MSLGMFVAGCGDTTTQKEKKITERKVETNRDTGEQKVTEETENKSTDDETGAKIETKSEDETIIKPGQDEDGNAADTSEPAADDNQ